MVEVDVQVVMGGLVLVLLVLAVLARRRSADPVGEPLRGGRLVLVAVAHLAPLLTLPVVVPLVLTLLVRRDVRVRARVARAFDLQVVGTLLAYATLEVVVSTRTIRLDDLVWIDAMVGAVGVVVVAAGVLAVVGAWRGTRLLAWWRPLLTPAFARTTTRRESVPEATSRPR
ncbi:hypothetical protein [Aeromicrobium massiliense]|uniref:hypothetical protein n=1 Tax=Aeromicrobium massiliense TaxID=1464554 RepID=UPI00031ED0D3|nr:hypothetical protein [Aeromicrobium massiliense]